MGGSDRCGRHMEAADDRDTRQQRVARVSEREGRHKRAAGADTGGRRNSWTALLDGRIRGSHLVATLDGGGRRDDARRDEREMRRIG